MVVVRAGRVFGAGQVCAGPVKPRTFQRRVAVRKGALTMIMNILMEPAVDRAVLKAREQLGLTGRTVF